MCILCWKKETIGSRMVKSGRPEKHSKKETTIIIIDIGPSCSLSHLCIFSFFSIKIFYSLLLSRFLYFKVLHAQAVRLFTHHPRQVGRWVGRQVGRQVGRGVEGVIQVVAFQIVGMVKMLQQRISFWKRVLSDTRTPSTNFSLPECF